MTMHIREMRVRLRESNLDPRIQEVIMSLAESAVAHNKALSELGSLMSRMTDILNAHEHVMAKLIPEGTADEVRRMLHRRPAEATQAAAAEIRHDTAHNMDGVTDGKG